MQISSRTSKNDTVVVPAAEGAPAWAAVGPLPAPEICPPERRVELGEVPLRGCPAWLGIDRALAGWGAWRAVGEAVGAGLPGLDGPALRETHVGKGMV